VNTAPRGYDRVAIFLHWSIGVALLAQIAFGFLVGDIAPRGTPERAAVINLHKSCGMLLGILVVARLAWRLRHRPPLLPESMPGWQQRAALLNQRALYACMIVMPLSGYVASNFNKYGIVFFGVPLRPWGADLPQVYNALGVVHGATGWLFSVLIAFHVAAALKHLFIDRDGVVSRMWTSASL
jgi:cytochrome b561